MTELPLLELHIGCWVRLDFSSKERRRNEGCLNIARFDVL
jgi:hypothetical protein